MVAYSYHYSPSTKHRAGQSRYLMHVCAMIKQKGRTKEEVTIVSWLGSYY